MKSSTSGSQVKWCVTCMSCSLWTLRPRAWRIVQPHRLLCSTVVCSTGLGIGQTAHCSRFVSYLTYGPLCLIVELCGYQLVNGFDGCNFLSKTHAEDFFNYKAVKSPPSPSLHLYSIVIILLLHGVTGSQNMECCNDSWAGCRTKSAGGRIRVLLWKEPA